MSDADVTREERLRELYPAGFWALDLIRLNREQDLMAEVARLEAENAAQAKVMFECASRIHDHRDLHPDVAEAFECLMAMQ